ncbi:MAG TPA: AMP-binding protein, partial [Pirellula sp.]|nr:AMP-binding protein [Pirellula sp.]
MTFNPNSDLDTEKPWVHGLTIGQVLRETAKKYPSQDAVVFCDSGVRLSWSAFDAEVDRVARSLLALGLKRGDHFGVWATNVPEWVTLQFATARIGVVLVTINPSYRTNELAHAVGQSELCGLASIDKFKSTDYFASLQEAIPELANHGPGMLQSSQFPKLKWVITLRGKSPEGTVSWRDFLSQAESV